MFGTRESLPLLLHFPAGPYKNNIIPNLMYSPEVGASSVQQEWGWGAASPKETWGLEGLLS